MSITVRSADCRNGRGHIIGRLGIGGRFAAVVIAAGALLWCDGTLAAETKAILLRGYLGLFSDGLDRLAQELRARGINAEVRKHLYWTTTVSDILRERAAGKVGALILMGHSQGGNDAIEIARALEISHVPVDLLVTFDPYTKNQSPPMWRWQLTTISAAAGGWRSFLSPGSAAGSSTTTLPQMRLSLTSTSMTVAGSTPMSCARLTPCGRSIRKSHRCPGAGGGDIGCRVVGALADAQAGVASRAPGSRDIPCAHDIGDQCA